MYQLVGEYELEDLLSPGDDFVLLGDRFISIDMKDSIHTVSTTYYDPWVDTLYTTGHSLGGYDSGEYFAWFDFSSSISAKNQKLDLKYDFEENGFIQNTEDFVYIEQFDELYSISLSNPIWIQRGDISIGDAYLYHQSTMVPISITTKINNSDDIIHWGCSSINIMDGMSGTPVIQKNRLVGVLYATGKFHNNYVYIKPIV